ncbi:MAG: response regulator [Planctomycetaceae bacterium]|nr:MAG: response regulator [Planctomycetaceae bacterium]
MFTFDFYGTGASIQIVHLGKRVLYDYDVVDGCLSFLWKKGVNFNNLVDKMNVLIAEDNEESRYLLKKLLKGYGHEITAVPNGVEALEQAMAQPPDIIVSDIMMPEMDGFQLCQECKQNEHLKDIPFIFYTATYTSNEDEKFALSLGADAFILKPAEPDIFVRKLSEEFEKAKLKPLVSDKIVPLEPSHYLTEYSKRIVAKLESKIAQLDIEIAERKRAEENVRQSLLEKEVMLKEIHHRVKNNMQVISSLLNLQAGYIEDERALDLFKECQNRVRTMSLIHERLYQAEDLASINFTEYIRRLTGNLLVVYRIDTGIIKLNIYVEDVFLDINKSIPCGLIINELVSNVFKHAFPEGSEGEVSITLTEDKVDKKYTLIVSDDGVSFPEGLDFRETETLGMRLVNILTEQLHGTIELDRSGGTSFKIVF